MAPIHTELDVLLAPKPARKLRRKVKYLLPLLLQDEICDKEVETSTLCAELSHTEVRIS
jgi:hypothetical protein